MRVETSFAEEARRVDAAPERLALAVARLAYPALMIEDYLARLDEMAGELAPTVLAAPQGEARARALLAAVNDQLGLRGNRERYYEAENSFLNRVLERGRGLPILLCVIIMALGRRLGLQVDGLGFPGHFMARYRDAAGEWLLDPFYGAVVQPASAAGYLAGLFDREVALPEAAFLPVSPLALAQRILNNLRNVYLAANDYSMAARVVDHMLALAPGSLALWQERGVISYQAGDLEGAARALRRYFFLTGRLQLALFQVDASEGVALSGRDQELLGLLSEIDRLRQQLN
jgi:regulator of sirC expression with transglutaminase-like and TPR domain